MLDKDLETWLEWVEYPDLSKNKAAFDRASPIAERLQRQFFTSGHKLYRIAKGGVPQLYVPSRPGLQKQSEHVVD